MRLMDAMLSPLGRAWLWATLWRTPPAKPIGEPHEVEPQCEMIHCFGHDRDEPGQVWLVCGECFHRYGSARELRKLYRREAWRAHRRWSREPVAELPEPFTIPDLKVEGDRLVAPPTGLDLEWSKGPSTLKVLWRLATIRASKIYFCQVCIHDF